MPVINIEVGQLVFIIDKNDIYEGNIVGYLNQKEVFVTSKSLYYQRVKKIYGVNFFFTRDKATKVLALKLAEERKRELELEQVRLKRRQEQLEREGQLAREAKKTICNACGLPIGAFGHCGCSY